MSKTENAFQSLWTKKGGSLKKQDRQKQTLLQIFASLNQYGQVYTSLYQFRQVCYNSNKFVLIQTKLDKEQLFDLQNQFYVI